MSLQLAWLALGLLLLVLGADSFVKGASGVALRFGIRPFVVGMVLVGFGTSAPELAVNLTAAWNGSYEMAVGNVVGSNIANIGLILGVCALLAPLLVRMRLLRVEVPLLVAVCVVLWLMALDGSLGRIDGVVLLAGFAGLLVLVMRDARSEPDVVQVELAEAVHTHAGAARNALRLVVGLALMLYAAHLIVGAAVFLAGAWGMSELAIGLTVVAVGTSLPELAASAVAAWRGQSDLAVGNVVGSCLFNILLILGLTSLVHPLPVSVSLLWIELPAMAAFALALYPIVRGDLRIERHEGAILVVAYSAFIAWQLYLVLG